MYINEKGLALETLLKKIQLLEEQIEDSTSKYYIPFKIKVNGIVIEISLFELIQSIKYDYNNIVLKDFYDEFD